MEQKPIHFGRPPPQAPDGQTDASAPGSPEQTPHLRHRAPTSDLPIARAQPPGAQDMRAAHLRSIARLETLREEASRAVRPSQRQDRIEAAYAALPPQEWVRLGALPIDCHLETLVVLLAEADARPRSPVLRQLRRKLREHFQRIVPIAAPAEEIHAQLVARSSRALVQHAETSVPEPQSCRGLFLKTHTAPMRRKLTKYLGLGAAVAGVLLQPQWALTGLSLLLFTVLRGVGLFGLARQGQRGNSPVATAVSAAALPKISVMVPLYKEADIGRHLLRRLCRLTYDRNRLEVVLVLEEEDAITRAAVAHAELPSWFRVVIVPGHGALRTKPRAMNYALPFCSGAIIGVWDAEDAPEPHQLENVARHFAKAPPEVVCLQGVLDHYNFDRNWISRCFYLEYAGWFRVVLRGLAALHLVVPLGGTTMFIRRSALEALGAWDAFNVTEDADLGVRLTRRGWRTEMVNVTTYEEATNRPLAWVRQRSRWLKGFMKTYLVHMQQPRALLRDLGLWRFLGFQAFFLGSVGQFLLAPLLWSFWAMALGFGHFAQSSLPSGLVWAAVVCLLLFETLSLCIWYLGARASGRPQMALWAPLMPIYFIMGSAAAYKAAFELIRNPFYWDKTSHGQPDRPS